MGYLELLFTDKQSKAFEKKLTRQVQKLQRQGFDISLDSTLQCNADVSISEATFGKKTGETVSFKQGERLFVVVGNSDGALRLFGKFSKNGRDLSPELEQVLNGKEFSKEQQLNITRQRTPAAIQENSPYLCHKAFNFDLDTNLMGIALGGDYHPGYQMIGRTLNRLGYSHRQGSGYVSRIPIDDLTVLQDVRALTIQHPWLAFCVKEFDVTEVVGRQYSMRSYIQTYGMSISQNATSPLAPSVVAPATAPTSLTLTAVQTGAWTGTEKQKTLHDGFSILHDERSDTWYLLKDGFPKANGKELLVGDTATTSELLKGYSEDSAQTLLTAFPDKAAALDYWAKGSATYTALRNNNPLLNQSTARTQGFIDTLIPADFKGALAPIQQGGTSPTLDIEHERE